MVIGRVGRRVALLGLLLALPGACGGSDRPVVVFAATSLGASFESLAQAYEANHQGTQVLINLGGSSLLAAQIRSGAPADAFASADEAQMRAAGVVGGATFARGRIAIVTTLDDARIRTAEDLVRAGVRVVLAAPEVPVGRYARAYLDSLGLLGPVGDNLVSNEPDTAAVLNKVRSGEADAGIVYRTDVSDVIAPQVRVVELPEVPATVAEYRIAALERDGESFVDFVLSPAGRALLRDHGFSLP